MDTELKEIYRMTNEKNIPINYSFNRFKKPIMIGKTVTLTKEDSLKRKLSYRFTNIFIGKSLHNMINLNILGKLNRFILLTALFFVYGFTISYAQAQESIVVNGKVVNGINEPVANVAVAVEGSYELPAVTDENGNFTVVASSRFDWLHVEPSSKYKTRRIFLNNRRELTIYLTENDLSSGDDEINVLSQTRIKRNLVSSYSYLNTDNIKQYTSITIDQFFQGKIPGMHVVNRSGDPGSGAFILMRGINSLNASNQPLFIVDGIPVMSQNVFGSNLDGYSYNPLLSVNNLDVSKVTVIKDPAITAAYGSKASNGLIIIETLAPSAVETVIDFDFRSGYSLTPIRYIPQLNAGQHKTLISEVLVSSGKYEELTKIDFPNLFLTPKDDRFIDYQHDTKWQDIIFGNSVFSNININVKGGDEIARYGLSFGYMNANGIIKTTEYDGFNLRFVSLLNIFPWLKMDAGMSLNYSTSNLKESAKVPQTNPILTSLAKSPLLNPFRYDREGREILQLSPVDELGVSNPQAVIDNYQATNNNVHFISTVGAEATIKRNLILKSNFGLTYNVLKELVFMPNRGMERYYNNEAINVSKGTSNTLTSLYNNTFLRYQNNIGKNHFITLNTGVNLLTNDFELDWGLTKNAHENDHYRMLQDGTSNLRQMGGNNRKWNWVSFYENLVYVYKDKYLISGSVSLDGSSRIGRNAINTVKINEIPFGIFYGGGIGWRISNEPGFRNISWLDELKLRATYGVSGNDDIGESNATNYYTAVKFRETVGLYPALIPNEELSYETVDQINAGVDLALFGNRFVTSIDYYESHTKNMLIFTPLKAYLGYDFRPENSGRMQNKGIDLSVFFRMVDRPSFKWDLQTSLSTVKNEILEIKGNKLVTALEGAEIVNMPGAQANSFYGYIFEGVYNTTEEAQNAGLKNERLMPYRGGDAIYADLSGPNGVPDGIINDYDKTVIGSSLPEQFGGVTNTFTIKRWSLSTFFQFSKGNEVFNYVRFKNESMTGLQNQSTNALNRWQYEGHVTSVPRAVWNDPIGNTAFSTRWIEDGSYIRVKNVSLSYTVPNDFLLFRNAQFYITASNVFTFSKYLGYDPEFSYSYRQIDQGIDYGMSPQPRQFMVGIKLGL